MCGLFGVASQSNLGKAEKDMFELLAFISYLRGKDSTGMIAVSATGAVTTNKATVTPPEFLSMGKSKSMLAEHNLRALLGHTRAATVGSNVHANAHPFEFENVVGMHNGTLDYQCRVQYTNKPTEFGTDSEGLYNKINESSVNEVIPQLEGAWALTMWDKAQRKLRIVRNDKRTLYMIKSVDDRTVFWSSEADFLIFAANRLNYPISEDKNTGQYTITTVPANEHWSVSLLDSDAKWSMVPLESKKVYTAIPYRSPAYQGSYYDTLDSRAGNANRSSTTNSVTKSNIVPMQPKATAPIDYRKSNSILDPTEFKPVTESLEDGSATRYIKSIVNEKVYEEEFRDMIDTTCVACNAPIKFDDGALVVVKETAATDFVGVCYHCLEADPFMLPLLKDKVS